MTDSAVYKNGTKTLILLNMAPHRRVKVIPLSDTGLEIVTMGITEFEEFWTAIDYEVTLAAERYLNFSKLHGASEEAFAALQNLVRRQEVPVEERKVYSNGSQMVINISPIDGSNINVVGLVGGKVTLFGLSQKEFGDYKELKNKAKDTAKKFYGYERIQGAEPQALRLLQEVISGKSINHERKVEMARKKAEPEDKKVVATPPEIPKAKAAKTPKSAKEVDTRVVKLKDKELLKGDLLPEIGIWVGKRKNPPTRQQVIDAFVEKGHPKVSVACCITAGVRSGGLSLG